MALGVYIVVGANSDDVRLTEYPEVIVMGVEPGGTIVEGKSKAIANTAH